MSFGSAPPLRSITIAVRSVTTRVDAPAACSASASQSVHTRARKSAPADDRSVFTLLSSDAP
jgi:hypothetical protein